MKIVIVGCGNIGLTYAQSFLQYENLDPNNLYIIEKNSERLQYLEKLNFKNLHNDNHAIPGETDYVILSIKPQDFGQLDKLNLSNKTVIISIMAGITVNRLKGLFPENAIIRAMPNLASQIGMGMTGFYATDNITLKQLREAEHLFNTTGRSILVEEENDIDKITAVSGSGPAYLFYFIKSFIDAATSTGLDSSTSILLVKQTILGAFHLFNQDPHGLEKMIEKVSSRGGTTEAAINVFKKMQFSELMDKAIHAALQRAKELNK